MTVKSVKERIVNYDIDFNFYNYFYDRMYN